MTRSTDAHRQTSGRLGRWDRATMRSTRPSRCRLLCLQPAVITRLLTCSLRTAIACQLSGHHRHTAVPTQKVRRALYTLPLSISSSNLSPSRLTEEGDHGTNAAATSPLHTTAASKWQTNYNVYIFILRPCILDQINFNKRWRLQNHHTYKVWLRLISN